MTYSILLKDKIRAKVITKTNTVSTAIIRRGWFIESELNREIIESTKFLDGINPSISIRIKCIINNITELPKCVVCGNLTGIDKRKNKVFKTICPNCVGKIQRTSQLIKKTSDTHKKTIENKRKYFNGCYVNKTYSLLSYDDTRNMLVYFIDNTIKNRFYRIGMIYSFIENLDLYCSVIFHTSSLIPISEDNNWDISQRLYHIYHNLKEIPKCIYCENDRPYINFNVGYQRTCGNNNKCATKLNQDICIMKYGTPMPMLSCYKNGYSKSSQDFFRRLYELLPDDDKKHCHFKEHNDEYMFRDNDNDRIYFADFTLSNRKVIVEFNGDYWHMNPKCHKSTDIHILTGKSAEEIWNHDKERHDFISSKGFKIITIWESSSPSPESVISLMNL